MQIGIDIEWWLGAVIVVVLIAGLALLLCLLPIEGEAVAVLTLVLTFVLAPRLHERLMKVIHGQ